MVRFLCLLRNLKAAFPYVISLVFKSTINVLLTLDNLQWLWILTGLSHVSRLMSFTWKWVTLRLAYTGEIMKCYSTLDAGWEKRLLPNLFASDFTFSDRISWPFKSRANFLFPQSVGSGPSDSFQNSVVAKYHAQLHGHDLPTSAIPCSVDMSRHYGLCHSQ